MAERTCRAGQTLGGPAATSPACAFRRASCSQSPWCWWSPQGVPATGTAHEGFFIGRDGEFEADADADVFAGPAPLTVKFSARAQHASGRVTYRWKFDDGTTSTEQSPSHALRRRGWYNVTMEARDAAGHVYQMNLLLHAWQPKDWARLQAHRDVRIMRHAALELERKRSRDSAASGVAPSANAASADSGSIAPH